MGAADPLARYNAKRDFGKTPEPSGKAAPSGKALGFVIQKHWASRLHYDFRLELDGVLVSWAVPKGPSFDPKQKRMAIHVEDHPVSYGTFEGTIPAKQYGAGNVIVWDRGSWAPVGDPRDGLRAGKLVFALHGEKLAGLWELIRIAKPDDRQEAWLLFKKRDAWARPFEDFDVTTALPDSVVSKPLGLVEAREPRAELPVEAAPVAKAARPRKKKDGAAPIDAAIAGAVERSLPAKLAPQLAVLTRTAPSGPQWTIEAKFDGYRVLARIEKGRARMITRNGHDWTSKLDSLAAAVETLGIDSGWLDGEMVVLRDDGGQDFNALQNAIDESKGGSIVYFLFDVPFLGGYDLRAVPLVERRRVLKAILDRPHSERVRFSDDFPSDARTVLEAACKLGYEGVIAKRNDAPYVSARTESWVKLKCTQRQEFVIGGFTDRAGSNTEVGGLLLGVHDDDGKLRYAGALGTGWNPETARSLKEQLVALETKRSPFETGSVKQGRWSKRVAGSERWVEPVLVAEVSFAEWTPDGHLRHAVFQGLRTDKSAKEIMREAVIGAPAKAPAKATRAPAPTVKVSNPDRVIDASTGFRKLDLFRYYESVADLILPHLQGRPVSLVRGPAGIAGELFFQKHLEAKMPGVTVLDASLWPGHAALISIDTVEALLSAAQMNTIELHTWNAKAARIDQPDRVVFDLDPGEGTPWAQVQEAAMLTRALLEELELASFLKTSGGKGLHLVVPLTPRADWDTVRNFSQAVVQHLAKTIPDRFVAKAGPSNRVGKLFVDYLRNGHGATTAIAFSARARPGMGVSIPIAWEELEGLESGAEWTIATARDHLSFRKADPWADYWKTKQTITKAAKRLG